MSSRSNIGLEQGALQSISSPRAALVVVVVVVVAVVVVVVAGGAGGAVGRRLRWPLRPKVPKCMLYGERPCKRRRSASAIPTSSRTCSSI